MSFLMRESVKLLIMISSLSKFGLNGSVKPEDANCLFRKNNEAAIRRILSTLKKLRKKFYRKKKNEQENVNKSLAAFSGRFGTFRAVG